jgi:hypothetical protein
MDHQVTARKEATRPAARRQESTLVLARRALVVDDDVLFGVEAADPTAKWISTHAPAVFRWMLSDASPFQSPLESRGRL